MASWSNIFDFNNYLSQSFGGDTYLKTPSTTTVVGGSWVPASGNMMFAATGGNAQTEIGTGDYVYSNYRAYQVKLIRSNNLVELDREFFAASTGSLVYNFPQTEATTILTNDSNKIKALFTAQSQIVNSPEYIFPTTTTDLMKYGLYEWAVWILSGGKNQGYEDYVINGLKSKTVDVLQWQYRDSATIYSGPASAQKYLETYRNPNYEPGLGNSNTTFSM